MDNSYRLNDEELRQLKDIARDIRCSILTMIKEAGVGRIRGSLSLTDIVNTFRGNKKDYNINISYSDFPKENDNVCDEKLGYILHDDDLRRIFYIAY